MGFIGWFFLIQKTNVANYKGGFFLFFLSLWLQKPCCQGTQNHIQDTVFSKKGKLDANQLSEVHKHVKMTLARWTVTPVEFNSLFLKNCTEVSILTLRQWASPKLGFTEQLKRKMHKFRLNVFQAPPKKRPVALHLIVFFHSRLHNW